MTTSTPRSFLSLLLIIPIVAACGGGSVAPAATPIASPPITSFELIDPTPGANDRFGEVVAILANGNVVVTDPDDSSVAASAGAVHLYDPRTRTRIASIYGDTAGDQLGIGGVTALGNGNFVIVSPLDDVGGVVDAGSVMLVNGATGAQIGSALTGDQADDLLGFEGVTALGNGNYVIVSPLDDAGVLVDAGSVMLVNGTTGAQIGSALTGDQADDVLGFEGVTALVNGNYVVVSPFDDASGVVDAGSVMLVNGATGAQIGSTIAGDQAGDLVGISGVTALGIGNYVIASPVDDVGGVVDAGSVMLVNGTTGAPVGTALTGNDAGDRLGDGGVTALGSGNYVIASPFDDAGGVADAGSVMLVNGTTGAQIGSTLAGDQADDQLGIGGVTALGNGNCVIVSPLDDAGVLVDAGSVMLVNGTTGAQIGSTLAGDQAGDVLGVAGVTALGNGNYVIASALDDVGGVVDAGSVMLVNGTTGAQIGNTLAGNQVGDLLGSEGVTALGNGNYVIASALDDVGGVVDAGSVTQVSGTTGAQIGSALAGSIAGDMNFTRVAVLSSGEFFVLGFPSWDNTGGVDSGLVRLIAQ